MGESMTSCVPWALIILKRNQISEICLLLQTLLYMYVQYIQREIKTY